MNHDHHSQEGDEDLMADSMLDSQRVNVSLATNLALATWLVSQVPWDELKSQLGTKEAKLERFWEFLGYQMRDEDEHCHHKVPESLGSDSCSLVR